MKRISLTQGHVALVDDFDYDWLSERRWCVSDSGSGKLYAYRKEQGHTLYMHQLIASRLGLDTVDHIDKNGLNNQRRNLRAASKSTNALNRNARGWTITPRGKFRAQLQVSGIYWSRVFDTEQEAMNAYNQRKERIIRERSTNVS